MKKFLIFIVAVLVMSACTRQNVARSFGGEVTIEVTPGYKVTSATWKENDIFYFIEPMEDCYVPKEKMFVESSSWGVLESVVKFKEKR